MPPRDAAPPEPVDGPLRAADRPRTLSPARTRARLHEAAALDAVCRRNGVTNAALAHYLGLASDRDGARFRFGARALSVGEALDLLPRPVAAALALELLRPRYSGSSDDERLAALHLDAALVHARRAA